MKHVFTDPSGQQHTLEGPEGSTRDEAFKVLQGQLGGQQQKQQPADDSYQSKLTAAMNTAMKALAPSWEHNKPGYNPLKPADPKNMPNDAVNPVGTDAQMAAALGGSQAAGGAMGGLAAMSKLPPRPRPAPPQQPVNMGQMPTQQGIQNRMGLGGQAPPSSPVGGAPPPAGAGGAGDALQQKLLQSGMAEKAGEGLGHMLGGPVGGAIGRYAGRYAPKILGME